MRVSRLDADSAVPKVGDILAGLPAMQLFGLAAHAEDAFAAWLSYLRALHSSLELDPQIRELAILQVAHDERCDYERVQHEAIARRVGVADDQIAAIAAGETPDGLPPEAGHALRAVREIVTDGEATEEAVSKLVAAVGERQAVELVLLVGQYISLARLMKTFALTAEPPVVESAP